MGLGVGQLTMTSSATDLATSLTVKVEITALTITPNIGWMWGLDGGGLFWGVDFGFQSPQGAKTTLTDPFNDETRQEYIDAVKQGNDLGSTGFPTFTMLRLGYLF